MSASAVSSLHSIDRDRVPTHVAIIMDGNGRWAQLRGRPRSYGHRNGLKAVKLAVEAAGELGVKYLTLYAFSSENWSRPRGEIDALMALLITNIHKETETLVKNNLRLLTIGNLDRLPPNVQALIAEAKQRTAACSGLTIVVALSYGSRLEICAAVGRVGQALASNRLSPDALTPETLSEYLDTSGLPDPELLIRTSGEHRLSNFLLWQIAYAELYFTDVLWPDFGKEDFFKAIANYQARQRRFGRTGEQVT